MELVKITENVCYIPNVTNIGVIKNGNEVVLIDSGIDNGIAKKILKCLESEKLSIRAIINTHYHADHIGGNAYLKEKTGAKIYSPSIENGIIEHPYLEPFCLFSGAEPLLDMKSKFLMAKPSTVDYVIKEEEIGLDIGGTAFTFVHLPGHSLNQLGIIVDDILFCADALLSEALISRHKIPFCIDIKSQKATLISLRQSKYSMYVPSHGDPVENITTMADAYIKVISEVETFSLEILKRKTTNIEYIKQVCDRFKIDLKAIGQYYLMNTVCNAYLSYLSNMGKIKYFFEDNMQYWEKQDYLG
jgi:glyoxylase-like metal-dependent hydrolase (beta-lactamase superfamily II)